jgi:hypothetical protein
MEHRITIVDDEGEIRSALRRLFKDIQGRPFWEARW